MLRVGVDTGGTFTDFVVWKDQQTSVLKLPSTPDRPEKAVLEGLSQILQEQEGYLIQHGSTVATNALLERRGARTILLTNLGFEDILEIGRQDRPGLYQLSSSRSEPLVPSRCRIGIKERRLNNGEVLIPLDEKSLEWLSRKIELMAPESIAVVLLYSYVNPESEKRIAETLGSTQIPISLSHCILPEFREYERTSATVINAYLTPIMSRYLASLKADPVVRRGTLTIMQSNGGSTSSRGERLDPVRTLLSGPAGGVVGAFELAREAGYEKIISFDMGGTSTDVCLCDGEIRTTRDGTIDGMPLPVQMVGVHTVGAGGGSIAWLDAGGLLRVGPRSAGADPGPVCCGRGKEITVTDANVYLGRMDPDYFLGGQVPVEPERIRPALEQLGQALTKVTGRSWEPQEIAEGLLQITNTQIEVALRLISLHKGYDTRDFTLVSFGGAGGLHACQLARSVLIPRILVPADPGLLSALGILRADMVKDASLTVMLSSEETNLSAQLERRFTSLVKQVREQLTKEGFSKTAIEVARTLDLRYAGQAYELNLTFSKDYLGQFHHLHEQSYGYSNPHIPVEIVSLRVQGRGRYPKPPSRRYPACSQEPIKQAMIQEKTVIFEGKRLPTGFYQRSLLRTGNRIQGPAVILEYSSTILIPPDFKASIDEWHNLVIEPVGS